MTLSDKQQRLRQLPGVDHLLESAKTQDRFNRFPRSVLTECARKAVEQLRQDILADRQPTVSDNVLLDRLEVLSDEKTRPRLVSVINGTGVVLHTNLGRALLCEDALKNIYNLSKSYSNLELNISTGKRGIRYSAVENLIRDLTGAQGALVVNNNAGAVLLALDTLARETEAVVSRGELVEIGGSFRIPDVMEKSGCTLKEVGTTNRTHLRDYESAINENTGLLLKVHTSNYKITGFTTAVPLKDMVDLGNKSNIPVMEDLGSGTLIDYSKYGLPAEPTVAEAVKAGADIVTFSGDKLLGGPQAGIIVGKKDAIDRIKKNPLTRALRIDKMTLAALEATLHLYRDEAVAIKKIPTLRMLTMPFEDVCTRAQTLMDAVKQKIGSRVQLVLQDMNGRPGGGSFPEFDLPTRCLAIRPNSLSAARLEKQLRLSTPAIIGRIEDDCYILDPRTIQDGQNSIIAETLARVLEI